MMAGGALVGFCIWSSLFAQDDPAKKTTTPQPVVANVGLPRAAGISRADTGRLVERPLPRVASVGETENVGPARPDGTVEAEYLVARPQLAQCRIEVARRRRVAPSRVAAESVTLRWTIDRAGRVHDAEAVSAEHTDLEVAACAKRVMSEWTFSKRAEGPVTVEWKFEFP
jgi:hypothetical protein